METLDNQENQQSQKSYKPWIITILMAAWLIGMSIVVAGYLISKEIAKQTQPSVQLTPSPEPIDLEFTKKLPNQGSDDAKVTVIEFADFQCPYCEQWQREIYPKLKSEYIDTGKIKFYFWDLAFLGDESIAASEAALCARDQNKYWEYHDELFARQNGENQNAFSVENLKKIGVDLGLDSQKFNSCVDSRTHKAIVEDLVIKATEQGIVSTPTVLVNGVALEGVMPWADYAKVIDRELSL